MYLPIRQATILLWTNLNGLLKHSSYTLNISLNKAFFFFDKYSICNSACILTIKTFFVFTPMPLKTFVAIKDFVLGLKARFNKDLKNHAYLKDKSF